MTLGPAPIYLLWHVEDVAGMDSPSIENRKNGFGESRGFIKSFGRMDLETAGHVQPGGNYLVVGWYLFQL